MNSSLENLLDQLEEQKKSIIVAYGSEPVLINSIKKDISKTCKELNIEKKSIAYNLKITTDEIKSKFKNQSLFLKKP